ncbi:MAG: cytochrome c biogenesis protein CcdA, partial [Chloroflexota bacterium]
LYLGRGLSVRAPHREAPRVVGSSRAMVAYGIAYALASLGCTLPIFLMVVGTSVASAPLAGLAQFVAYGLGMGVVLTAVAVSAAVFRGIVGLALRRLVPYVRQVSALLLVVAGGYVLWVDLPRVLA